MCGLATFCVLCSALVLPQPQYCCTVWHPCQINLADRLESMHRRATWTFFARQNEPLLPYEGRLKRLRWQPLSHWRRVARVNLICHLLDGPLKGLILCRPSKAKQEVRAVSTHLSADPLLLLLSNPGEDSGFHYGFTQRTFSPAPRPD